MTKNEFTKKELQEILQLKNDLDCGKYCIFNQYDNETPEITQSKPF